MKWKQASALSAGLVLVLLNSACFSQSPNLKDARTTTESFLSDLQHQQYQAAYKLLCDQLKSELPLDDFMKSANTSQPIDDYSIESSFYIGEAGREAIVKVVYSGAHAHAPYDFRLRAQGGKWSICSNPF